jgi:hypothetical protein
MKEADNLASRQSTRVMVHRRELEVCGPNGTVTFFSFLAHKLSTRTAV